MAEDFAEHMSVNLAINELLLSIQAVLDERGQSLQDFGLPQPLNHSKEITRELQKWSLHTDRFHNIAHQMVSVMNSEQRLIYDCVIDAVNNDHPLLLFIQARAGCGKTFVVNAICHTLRSQQRIVLPTASTALAASNYDGGRTAHSMYRVPVDEHSALLQSTITTRSARADLLRVADLHVFDEAPMANKAVPECIDNLMRLLCNANSPFGGRRFVFVGDWAQIPPVIKGGSRAAIINASLKSSMLWSSFQVMHLTHPVRNANDPAFSTWVETLADNEHPHHLQIPQNLIMTCFDREELIDFVFPPNILHDPNEVAFCSILCPLNIQVAKYNSILLNRLHTPDHVYYSADSIVEDDSYDQHDPMADIDHLNAMRLPGIPDHALHLKVGAICVLTRNFSIERNLTKNTKVQIIQLGQRVVVVKVLRHNSLDGDEVIVLPRIDFTYYYATKGWTIRRRQFPLRLAYASTINSAQGMTLRALGFDATHSVFTHGQLYTVFSRVTNGMNCMIRVQSLDSTIENVVFSELL